MRLPAFLLLLAASLSLGCSRTYLDPNAGAETLYLNTMDHPELFTVEYLRSADEGPLLLEKNALDLLWIIPVNRPDLGIWLMDSLPPGATAANVRAETWTPWYGHLIFFPTLGLVDIDRVRFQADPVRIVPVGEPTP